jgi:AcrR family transcriptional regulator
MSSVNLTAPQTPGTRMRADERRALVLEAATQVIGERGYHGATTDAVARAAGVSQPYVVRMFGSKEALFLAVLDRALDRLMGTFVAAVDEGKEAASTGDVEAITHCIAQNYVGLLADRGLLLSLMQAFMLGADPVIGPAARAGMRRVYEFLREHAGMGPMEAHDFLARGMMLNTLVGLRMSADYETEPSVRELLDEALPTKLDFLLSLRDAES